VADKITENLEAHQVMFPKQKRFKSEKLRLEARNSQCMNCFMDVRDVVCLAHLPDAGISDAGTSQKTDDWCGAYLCKPCHDYADGEGRKDWEFRHRVMVRTWRYWIDKGLITIQ